MYRLEDCLRGRSEAEKTTIAKITAFIVLKIASLQNTQHTNSYNFQVE